MPKFKLTESQRRENEAALAKTLLLIEIEDKNYPARYQLVLIALALSAGIGYVCGIGFDEKEGTDWPVVFIELPKIGQVSWHMPAYPGEFDGHSTEEKYSRCRKYAFADMAKPLNNLDRR